VLADLVWANLTWGATNLVPVRPLDAAIAFRAVCQRIAVDEAARALSAAAAGERPSLAVEAFVVTIAVGQRQRAAGRVAPSAEDDRARAPHEADQDDPWLEALTALRRPAGGAIDAVLFGRVREAAEVLLRDVEAARIGEALLDGAPDPDLAFALSCAWARAGDTGRAAGLAVRAIELGFRDWERATEAPELAKLAGDRAWRGFERARREAGGR
jgi:hypothetical protein